MSAFRVWSGRRPSWYHSVRAISAPPRRPETMIFTPLAPKRNADSIAFFIARRNAIAAEQLTGNRFRHQLRVELGALDLLNVDVNRHDPTCLHQVVTELVDLGTLAADDDSGPRGVDRDPQLVGRHARCRCR